MNAVAQIRPQLTPGLLIVVRVMLCRLLKLLC
jgi:hypothetical protein